MFYLMHTFFVFFLFLCLQGLKKPYNPILGETFRCCWLHPQTNSCTFYIAEQVNPYLNLKKAKHDSSIMGYIVKGMTNSIGLTVYLPLLPKRVSPSVLCQVSHHPPISAFYVCNRKDGFCISGSILAKSKFYGTQSI